MTLLALCEPLFLYICRLNRSARKGGTHDVNRVRSEIQAIFDGMKARSAADPHLGDQYLKVELPLIFFVDFMIKESQLSFAREWKELAFARKELAGDEKFFDLLDETLRDESSAASERLTVFYTCLGLGFTGIYTGRHDHLRKLMHQCAARIRSLVDLDEMALICPEAYEYLNTSNFIQPPGAKLLGIAIALVGMIAVLFVANVFAYKWCSDDLRRALDAILAHDCRALAPREPAATAPPPPPAPAEPTEEKQQDEEPSDEQAEDPAEPSDSEQEE